ncbi:MAG: molybdopterin-synthase adenylyltransferase MoeB [Nitrospira sp.]|nr:molybdopterin-synthase adenylyltransferase MoeB [Candidatus Manganitrophaceae bacterium]HIL35061.1 molybdopterin-synthase adenylyltransferase MoeB [Candidatus Manganitrophaceae bacterium]
MDFTEEQLERYSRQILLPGVGGKGQRKISAARIFLIGAGGLGSPAALYLAAAGVGTLGIIDDDAVDLSNLQRQILHSTLTLGHQKVASAQATLTKMNPDIQVVPYAEKLSSENILNLFKDYDIILDGSDNFATRFLVNDAAYFQKKTLVSGSIFRFEGQLTTIKPHDSNGVPKPCYRCLYPEPPPAGLVPSCQEAGVLGVLAGTIGVMQASEALKEILGIGTTLAGRLLIYDALEMSFRNVRVPKDPNCPLCGPNPKITQLLEYDISCTLPAPRSLSKK